MAYAYLHPQNTPWFCQRTSCILCCEFSEALLCLLQHHPNFRSTDLRFWKRKRRACPHCCHGLLDFISSRVFASDISLSSPCRSRWHSVHQNTALNGGKDDHLREDYRTEFKWRSEGEQCFGIVANVQLLTICTLRSGHGLAHLNGRTNGHQTSPSFSLLHLK